MKYTKRTRKQRKNKRGGDPDTDDLIDMEEGRIIRDTPDTDDLIDMEEGRIIHDTSDTHVINMPEEEEVVVEPEFVVEGPYDINAPGGPTSYSPPPIFDPSKPDFRHLESDNTLEFGGKRKTRRHKKHRSSKKSKKSKKHYKRITKRRRRR